MASASWIMPQASDYRNGVGEIVPHFRSEKIPRLGQIFLRRTRQRQRIQPVINQTEAVGHAVRAAYMFSGTANVAAITGDKTYLNAIDKIREDIIEDKFYLTGGTRQHLLPLVAHERHASMGSIYV